MTTATISPVKIIVAKPPVYDNICAAFGLAAIKGQVVYTYGDKIYNPDNIDLPDSIIEHEKVHMEQQGHNETGAVLWWGRYLREPEFRVDQEARAYGVQYAYICKYDAHTRPHRRHYLKQLALVLCGPLYNRSISYNEAVELIKHYAKEAG